MESQPDAQTKHLTALLAERHVDYCVLHGWESPREDPSSDIDIAVSPRDLTALELALRNGNQGALIQLLQHETSCYYFVLANRTPDGIRFTAVDVAVNYRRDGRVFFTAAELLRSRRPVNGLWAAAPQTEFAYLLVKKILKGALPEPQRARLEALCTGLGEEARRVAHRLLGEAAGDQIVRGLVQAEPASLGARLPSFRRALRRQVLARDPLNPIRYWVPELQRRWRRWGHPTGLYVAVLGPDGAGKSTLIEHLREQLRGVFRDTAVFHQRPTLLARKGSGVPVTEPHGKPPHPLWLSALKVPYYVGLYASGYLFGVRPRLVRSTLVLFDRYYDDLCADPGRYRYGGPAALVRIARRFIPSPDLYFILDVAEDTLLDRKQEVSRRELQRQRAVYRRLGRDLPAGVLLNGNLPANNIARAAADVIVDCLHQRYLRRRAHWFGGHASEPLEWLAAALCPSPVTPGFTSGGTPRAHPAGPSTFGWIATEDGRGYLIPLKSTRSSVRALDLYNVQSPKARLAKGILALAFRLGVGRRFLRPAGLAIDGLVDYLREALGREAVDVALSVGPRNPDRKTVLLVLTDEGHAIAYAKIGSSENTNALVRREAETLTRLSTGRFHAFDAPVVLHSGRWNGCWVCVQSAPKGKAGRSAPALTREYLAIVKELATFHTRWLSLKESEFWNALLEHAGQITHAHYRGVVERGIRRAEAWLEGASLPFHFCHGDFAPWNIKRGPQRPLVFDWEYARRTGVPAHDVIHFLYHTRRRLEKRDPREIHRTFLEDRRTRAGVQSHLSGLGAAAIPQNLLLFLYYLDRVARGAKAAPCDLAAHQELCAFANFLEVAEDWV